MLSTREVVAKAMTETENRGRELPAGALALRRGGGNNGAAERRKQMMPLMTILLVAWMGAVEPVLPEESPAAPPPSDAELFNALTALSAQDNDAVEVLLHGLLDATVADATWRDLFHAYFAQGAFTEHHATFWDHAIGQASGARRLAVIRVSCLWAAAGLWRGLATIEAVAGGVDESLVRSVLWLQMAGPELDAAGVSAVSGDIASALQERPEAVEGIRTGNAPLWLDLCAAVRRCCGESQNVRAFPGLLGAGELADAFWGMHRVFLLGGEILNEAQLEVLGSVLAAVPSGLHELDAVIIGDGSGGDPYGNGVTGAARAIRMPAIPLDAVSDPREFPPPYAQPVGPQFTLAAAREIVRAVQDLQFTRRPDLAARRDAILRGAGLVADQYLRRTVGPGFYVSNPDEFLPGVACQYFLDTELAFELALDMLDLEMVYPMSSFLLFADMMSGGSGSAPVFRIGPMGGVVAGQTRVGRAGLAEGPGEPGPVAAINLLGESWAFTLDPDGISVAFHRGGGPGLAP